MATLKHLASGEHVVLRARHVIGRNRTDVHLFISDADISRHHAYIFWQDDAWFLRDVSSNGIWLDDKQINQAQAIMLTEGTEIRFGRQTHNVWVLLDASAPINALVAVSDPHSVIALDSYNVLSAESPFLEIIRQEAGEWLLREDGQQRVLSDGGVLNFEGESWVLHSLPLEVAIQSTEKISLLGVDSMKLMFHVSQDEEHVSLKAVFDDGRQVDFGERTHHYLLLTLARQRSEHAQQGFDEAAQGWLEMDALCRMLGLESSHVNIQIHRARKQLKDLLPNLVDTRDLVERRVGSLRLRARRFDLYRGTHLEARLPAQSPVSQ